MGRTGDLQLNAFLTSTVNGGHSSTVRPGRFTSRRQTRFSLNGVGWALQTVWTFRKKKSFTSAEIRTRGRLAVCTDITSTELSSAVHSQEAS